MTTAQTLQTRHARTTMALEQACRALCDVLAGGAGTPHTEACLGLVSLALDDLAGWGSGHPHEDAQGHLLWASQHLVRVLADQGTPTRRQLVRVIDSVSGALDVMERA